MSEKTEIEVLKEELAKLREELVKNTQPSKDLKEVFAGLNGAKTLEDPEKVAREDRLLREKIELETRQKIEAESLINSFDTDYGKYLSSERLLDINSASMKENHRLVKKVKALFEDEGNISVLPTSLKQKAESIKKLDLTDEASYSVVELKSLLHDFVDAKAQQEKLIITNQQNKGVVNNGFSKLHNRILGKKD